MSRPNDSFLLTDATPRSSKTTINIGGFHVYLYGVEELTTTESTDTVVFFYVHGRTRTHKDSEEVAHEVLYRLRQQEGTRKGFVVATMDNRNHGTRSIDNVAINDWKSGNPKHAQDMLATMDGIETDVQLVMTFLASYVDGIFNPTSFIIGGMSLGGHVTWDMIAKDERLNDAIIVVGCPDLTHMLLERLGNYKDISEVPSDTKEWPLSIERLYVARDKRLAEITGKRLLIMNGAEDPLVPSRFTSSWLTACASQNDVTFVEQEKTGHALTFEMVDRMVTWLSPLLR